MRGVASFGCRENTRGRVRRREIARQHRVYSVPMAKVMISLPDELLASVDAEAARRGTTRSGLIRLFTDEALRQRSEERAATIDQLFAQVKPRGGDAVAQLKRLRPQP